MKPRPLLRVGPSGPAFRSINSALDEASPGAIIEVQAGLYEESLVLERPVTLEAIGKVVLDGGEQIALTVASDRVTVRGFGMRNDGAFHVVSLGEGLRVKLEDCLLVSSGRLPVVIIGEGAPLLDRCRIVGGEGVLLGASRPRFIDCEILKSAGPGLRAERGARPRLQRCRIAEGAGMALWLRAGGGCRADGCTFAGPDAVCGEAECVLDLADCDLLAGNTALALRGGKARLFGCRLTTEGRLALHGAGDARAIFRNCRLQARDTSVFWEGTGTVRLRNCEFEAAGSPFADEGATLQMRGCREV